LRNKSYHLFNKPYGKEEYKKKINEFDLGSYNKLEKTSGEVKSFLLKHPLKYFHGKNIVNSSGDYLNNCKNVKDSFMVSNSENLRFCQLLKSGPAANCYDYSQFSLKAEWIYESCWTGLNVSNIKFGDWNYHAHDLEYSFGCHGSGNLFGCIGLRSGEYCILNKQYSKDEYFSTLEKIKEQMNTVPYTDERSRIYKYGEYFPTELSPWAYNESCALEWFHLTKEEAEKQKYPWRDPDKREFRDATIEVPDHINDVKDEILAAILKCKNCGSNYQIIEKELIFYRRFQVPIPRECPLCRDFRRISNLNPITLHDRACDKCATPIKTSFAPERPEIVYCETCYQNEVV